MMRTTVPNQPTYRTNYQHQTISWEAPAYISVIGSILLNLTKNGIAFQHILIMGLDVPRFFVGMRVWL
jgi:hypothetical protein